MEVPLSHRCSLPLLPPFHSKKKINGENTLCEEKKKGVGGLSLNKLNHQHGE